MFYKILFMQFCCRIEVVVHRQCCRYFLFNCVYTYFYKSFKPTFDVFFFCKIVSAVFCCYIGTNTCRFLAPIACAACSILCHAGDERHAYQDRFPNESESQVHIHFQSNLISVPSRVKQTGVHGPVP